MTDYEGRILAPFTAEQADALNRYQKAGRMHPFTCPRMHDFPDFPEGGQTILIAVSGQTPIGQSGWICSVPRCDYTQDWAHAFMLDPEMSKDW